MKKISIFAVALAAMTFAACGGNKSANTEEQAPEKSFEQEQVEAKIKLELDSLSAELGRLDKVPFLQEGENGLQLTEEEKQVKPDYLLSPSVAENATTLAEKYRALAALCVDKQIASMYDMPTDEYEAAISKLAADIDDPSFKEIDNVANIHETSQKLYDAMNANGRINYFWQMVAGSLIEEFYVASQNSDKFVTVFDDESAAAITFRIVLLNEATTRLASYDPEFETVAKVAEALEPLDAITVDQLKAQLEETKEKVAETRNELIK
ncbi:MAG: hypothetical protein J6Y04_09120 [Bacteroidaceae bacterium]|nr:hypothetical protein [Bacteroidaceae bacterium]